MLEKREVRPPRGAICFGCNQGFDGGVPAARFDSDLVPPSDRPELAGLFFHPGHLIRYARRRNWNAVAEWIERSGPSNF